MGHNPKRFYLTLPEPLADDGRHWRINATGIAPATHAGHNLLHGNVGDHRKR